jgi:Tol biopolymer transport system component
VLVPGSCGNPSSPAWSPDGKRLAYLRHSSSSTALVVTESGRERLVAQMYPLLDLVAERMLDWSPDGRWIAACDKMEAEAPYSLYMFSPETGEKRLVSRWSEGPSVGDLDPRFSPKGDMLAFIRYENRLRKEVCVVSIQGGESRTLVGDLEKVGGVGWSRDGAYVLYSSNQESDHRLYRVALSAGGSDPQRTRTELYGSNPLQFSVSGGTDRLVYVESGDDLNIWRLDLRGGGDSSWAQVIASTGEDSAPQYSPDGQRIAFISDRSGSQQLWVSNADGSLPVQLTTGGLRPGHARWSPEGDLIVLNGHDGIVHTVPATGGDPKPLQGISCGMIGFAARPGWLLGSCRGNIAMVPATGGNPVTITSNGGLNARPSPVGDRVLYVRSRMSPEIWTVPVGGGPAVLVTNRLIPGCFGCWTPARTGVYYYRSEIAGGSPSIHFVSYDGTGDRFVANIPWRIPRLGTNHLSLTPDERYLLTVRRDTLSGDLYLVQPF